MKTDQYRFIAFVVDTMNGEKMEEGTFRDTLEEASEDARTLLKQWCNPDDKVITVDKGDQEAGFAVRDPYFNLIDFFCFVAKKEKGFADRYEAAKAEKAAK